MNLADLINRTRPALSEFWEARNARERNLLALAALVVAFGLFYSVLIHPALAGRKQLNSDLPVLRQQVAQLRELAKQASLLSAMPALPRATMTREGIEAALAHNGLKAQDVLLNGDFAKVQLSSVSFANTLFWLDDMQKTALLLVTDADIVALAQPDKVNATITLRRAGTD
ncbi:MAG: type II secretion system protein GspM [Gallionella sp.]